MAINVDPVTIGRELQRRKHAGRFEAAEQHIPVEAFVSEDFHIMVLKNGDLLAFWETEGIDPVCLSEEEIKEHTRILTMALNEADPRIAIHQYYIKDRAASERKEKVYADPIVNAIDGARSEEIGRMTFFSTRVVYAFEFKTSFSGGQSKIASLGPILVGGIKGLMDAKSRKKFMENLSEALGGERAVVVNERRFLEEVGEFRSAMLALTAKMEMLSLGGDVDASLAEAIGATRLEMVPLKGFDAFKVLHRLWNWDTTARANPFLPGPGDEVAPWIPQVNLDCRKFDTIWSGDRPVRMYNLRGLRDPVAYDATSTIRSLPCEMVVHTRFALMGTDQSSKFVADRIAKARNLGGFVKGDPMKVKRIEDMKVALKESVRGKPFGKWSCQIALSEDTLERLNDMARRFEGVCAGRGIVVRREELSKDFTFYAMFPGNHQYEYVTRVLQSKTAVAVLMPYRQSEGRGATPPRDSPFPEALCSINTYEPTTQRAGLPVNWWLSVGNIAHFAIIGKTGGGKSFLTNFIISNYGRYAGTADSPVGLKRWVIDKGHSYKSLCALNNGAYINVADPETTAKMNPWDLPPDELRSQIPNLVKLLGLMMAASATSKVELSEQEAAALSEAMRNMARHLDSTYASGEFGSLELLNGFLHGSSKVQERLKDWLPGGIYDRIFPSERDGMNQADFTVFNFEQQYVPDSILGPVFYYIISRINMTVESDEFSAWRKLCFVDETAAFITPQVGNWKSEAVTSEIRNFIRIAFKTWRKKNGVMGLASQEASDFRGDSEFWQTFKGQVPTKIFLTQKDLGDALVHPRDGLGVPMHLAEELQRLPRGAFLCDAGGMRRFLVLNPDPTSYAIYTTDPVESTFRSWWLQTHPYSEEYTPFQSFVDIGGHILAAKRSGAKEAHFRQIQREHEGSLR